MTMLILSRLLVLHTCISFFSECCCSQQSSLQRAYFKKKIANGRNPWPWACCFRFTCRIYIRENYYLIVSSDGQSTSSSCFKQITFVSKTTTLTVGDQHERICRRSLAEARRRLEKGMQKLHFIAAGIFTCGLWRGGA